MTLKLISHENIVVEIMSLTKGYFIILALLQDSRQSSFGCSYKKA